MAEILLPAPARYFPVRGGRYDVAPALRPLGTSFGNGAADAQVFQFDSRFAEYRENKLGCLAERRSKYSGRHDYSPEVARTVARFMAEQLAAEHPELFILERAGQGSLRLHCRLTREKLQFDDRMGSSAADSSSPYSDALDALCCQVQEDVAVVCHQAERGDWLAAFHVCAPSHWTPEQKLGQCFSTIHQAVPGMEPVNRIGAAMADAMIRRGPFVRFVWGIDTDARLNRHPEPPPDVPAREWQSPEFDPAREPPFYLRVERQVTWGFPEVGAALFVIRPYHTDGRQVCADPVARAQLRSGLISMSAASRRYKGIASYAEALIDWLGSQPKEQKLSGAPSA